MKSATRAFLIFLTLATVSSVASRDRNATVWLSDLNPSAPALQDLKAEIAENLKASYQDHRLAVPIRICLYRLKKTDNFFTVVTRTGQDPDTVASLNGLAHPSAVGPGDVLLIPNARGVFKRKQPLEEVVYFRKNANPARPETTNSSSLLAGFQFYPGRRFDPEERYYFKGQVFSNPVPGAILSSGYGSRIDPINNHKSFHGGIDLAAAVGTPVYASAPGKVIHAGPAGGYGNLIIIAHQYEYTTYYGHLSEILVKRGDTIGKGEKIGLVGSTGRVTGPHLHFEIRKDGKFTSPSKFFHP